VQRHDGIDSLSYFTYASSLLLTSPVVIPSGDPFATSLDHPTHAPRRRARSPASSIRLRRRRPGRHRHPGAQGNPDRALGDLHLSVDAHEGRTKRADDHDHPARLWVKLG